MVLTTKITHARLLSLAFAWSAVALVAHAATPVAVWDSATQGKELNTTQDVYHIEIYPGEASFSNGKLVIGSGQSSGGVIALTNDLGLTRASVLVKYSNFSGFTGKDEKYLPVLVSAVNSDNYEVGVYAENDASEFQFYWKKRGGAMNPASGPYFLSGRSGYFLFSYSATEGVRFSLGTTPSSMVESDRADYKFGGRTLTHVSIGGPIDSRWNDGWPGLVIEKVALFTDEFLSATDIESFTFPAATLMASDINRDYPGLEIDLTVEDGMTIQGDEPFAASKINFICDGSITIEPPANNETEFDFSRVEGEAVVSYTGTPPSRSGDYFTSSTVPTWTIDSTKWTNTIAFVDMTIAGPNFNNYGNTQSSLKLSGVKGWVDTGVEYVVPVVLENGSYSFALKLNNGNSPQNNDTNKNRCSIFRKVSGRGSIVDGIADVNGTAWPVIKIYDASDFHGDITLDRASLLICDSTTSFSPSIFGMLYEKWGALRVENGKAATLVGGKVWSVKRFVSSGNLTVDGTLSASVTNIMEGVLSGGGNIVASGFLPGGSFSHDSWSGTLSISNVAPASTAERAPLFPFNLQNYGGSNSTVRLTSIGSATIGTAYLPAVTVNSKVVLSDDGDTPALRLSDGLSDVCTTFRELAGDGTFAQIKDDISQGITINVMTNFTGKLLLNKMTVTFGTTTRNRQTDNWTAQSKLFIDSDAILSVPAGFALWAPTAVVMDGPIDFKTDEANYKDLLLLDNLGSDVQIGPNFAVSINGTRLKDLPGGTSYKVKLAGDTLVLKRFGSALRFR